MKLPTLNKTISLGTIFLIFILPLFFLSLTPDFYFFNKLILLIVGSSALLILFFIKHFLVKDSPLQSKGLSFTGLDVPILVFLGVKLASTFLNPHPAGAFYNDTGMILGLTLLYFLIKLTKVKSGLMQKTILGSASALALLTFYQAMGLAEAVFSWPWLKQRTWTPSGSVFNLFTFSIICLPLAWVLFKNPKMKSANPIKQALRFIPLIFIGLTLLIAVFPLINEPPTFLPLLANWQVSVEGFKIPRTLFLGVGPGNFMSAFTRAKPLYLNRTPVWNIIFMRGRSEYLHILTTTGLLGLASFAWLILQALKKTLFSKVFRFSFLLILLFFIFFPGSLLTWLVLYLILALAGKKTLSYREEILAAKTVESRKKNALLLMLPIFLIILSLASSFAAIRSWLAEFYTLKSVLAAQENKGRETYELQQKAINFNPYLDNYHLNFANISFLLANSISSSPSPSDQDQQMIVGLIQQAINETKIATDLAPHKSSNWQSRGNLYRNLINLAQGADQWTVICFQQAIRLDPANPILRVDFGGLFYLYRNYDAAIEQFKIAVQIKPDFANGWYNLSAAYRDDKRFVLALSAMQRVLDFLPEDSADRSQAQTEFEALKQKVEEMPREEPQPSEPQESLALPETPPATPSGVKPLVLPEPSPEPEEEAVEEEESEASPNPSPETPF